jgi:hypothetical protein
MSAKTRHLWIVPAALVASWLAVRSLAAFPGHGLDDPQPSFASAGRQVSDPALAAMISRLAGPVRERN